MSLAVPMLAAQAVATLAQEQRQKPRGLLNLLFGRSDRQVEEPAAETQRQPAPQPRRASGGSAAPARRAEPPSESAVEKHDNARVVLVVGDFLAGGLVDGLEAAYGESPGVRIVDRTNGSSGFVRDDYHDWNAEIAPLLEEERPSAVVVMIGSNDRQQLAIGGRRESPRSPAWTEAYVERVETFAEAIGERSIPLVWTGLPPFKSGAMSSDMLAFNDIYKRAAESVEGTFVDIWDGFVDEDGEFVFTGPDINGQPVRLRRGDGINLTQAARRKVAFYVEKPLNEILGEAASPEIDPLDIANLPDAVFGPQAPPVPDHASPMSLDDPEFDGSSELLGGRDETRTDEDEAGTPGGQAALEELDTSSRPGRADNFTIDTPSLDE